MAELHEKLKEFDEEFEMMINTAGHFYPPNNEKSIKIVNDKRRQEGLDADDFHPQSISSESCFDEYEQI